MSELTIRQIQDIIGWSYPTAFNFARENGRQNDDGVWLVPFDTVATEVQRRVVTAQRMQMKLAATGNGQRTP